VDEEVDQNKTGEADEMNLKLISKTRWCMSKWWICDFQGDEGTARKL